MQEEFEKNMEQHLGNFSLQPSPMVWKEVDAALRPERKRRLAIWWLMPLLLLLAGSTGYLFLYNGKEMPAKNQVAVNNKKTNNNSITGNNNNLPHQPAQKVTAQIAKLTKSSAQQHLKMLITKNEATKMAALIAKLSNTNTATHKQSFTKQKTLQNGVPENKFGTNGAVNDGVRTLQQQAGINEATKFAEDTKGTNRPTTTDKTNHTTTKSAAAINVADALKTPIATLKKVDSLTAATKKTITKISNTKKHQWLVTAGSGALHVGENTLFNNNSAEKAFASSNSNVQPPGGGLGVAAGQNVYPLAAPTNGFQLTTGMQYQQLLSKRWKLNTGLQYRYLQNKQLVKNDTTPFFQSLGVVDRFVSSFSNTSGKIVTVTNHAHWLEVPLTFSYALNPTSKNRVSLIAGGAVAWAFAEKWLISDAANSNFYYNTSLNNKLLFNVNAGLSLDMNSKLQIACMAQQSLTPIHKNTTDKFYYTQYTIQLSKPISFNKLLHKSSTKK